MMNIGELDKLYTNSESCDTQMFSEMRSNVLLVSGDHYNKKASKFWDRVQSSKGLKDSAKLRLTKNHTQTICARKVGKLLSHAPNTKITPNNPDEIQDQKTAQLNDDVWKDAKDKYKIRKKIRRWAEDFTQLGECWANIYWDETKGDFIGYEQATDEEGQPLFEETVSEGVDEFGQPIQIIEHAPVQDEKKPVMSGDFVFERIYAFNVLRDPNSQSLDESPYFIVRKMIEKADVKSMVDAETWASMDNMEESYLVFDGNKAQYADEKNKIMLRQFYFRPCKKYVNGYFYITVQGHLIEEGELPFGLFPIVYSGHTEIPTSCRYRSPIKQMRPYQIEINRAASKIAETQITLGDDKLILNNNAKISAGGTLAGLRGVKVTGGMDDIKVLGGRSGEQYLPYMQSQISELYQVMDEIEYDAGTGAFDAYAMLYTSSRNKERYKKHAEEFEDFIKDITDLFLQLAKHYYDEDTLIPIIGKTEMVNIAEFKHTEKNSFRINIENTSDDTDTMMGRQLSINHILQYVGKDIDQESIGKAIRALPFMNEEEIFEDLTIDGDMSKNDMLSIERGQMPPMGRYDNHKAMIKKATGRVKKPDFRFLDPQIQEMYFAYIKQHEQIEANNIKEMQRLQDGVIPTSGAVVKADLYDTTPSGAVERSTFPSDALEWLKEQLEAQGTKMSAFGDMSGGVQAELSKMVNQGQVQPTGQMQ